MSKNAPTKNFRGARARVRVPALVDAGIDTQEVLDIVNPLLALKADINSPTFTGTPRSPVLSTTDLYAIGGTSVSATEMITLGTLNNWYNEFISLTLAPGNHDHDISDVNGLQAALDGKASLAHTHSIADVTGLQADLDSKLSTTNGGAGSGYNADLLDGYHGSLNSAVNTYPLRDSSEAIFAKVFKTTADTSATHWTMERTGAAASFLSVGNTGDHIQYDYDGTGYKFQIDGVERFRVTAFEPTFSGNALWHQGNDGSGSGLDADLLDGLQSTAFPRSNVFQDSTDGYWIFGAPTGSLINGTSGSLSSLEVRGEAAGDDAFMSFHVPNQFAAYFGIDSLTNDLAFGGWSYGSNKYRIWHEGNINLTNPVFSTMKTTAGGSATHWTMERTGAFATSMTIGNTGNFIRHDYNGSGYSWYINGAELVNLASSSIALRENVVIDNTTTNSASSSNYALNVFGDTQDSTGDICVENYVPGISLIDRSSGAQDARVYMNSNIFRVLIAGSDRLQLTTSDLTVNGSPILTRFTLLEARVTALEAGGSP